MPKAIKYYSDEELEQKLKELENLKAQREKEKRNSWTVQKSPTWISSSLIKKMILSSIRQ